MASSGGSSNLILLGAVAVGGYFLYQWYTGQQLPADAMYNGQVPIGTAVAIPQSFALKGTATAGAATTALAYMYYSPFDGSDLPVVHGTDASAAQRSGFLHCTGEYADNVEYSCRDSDTCACYAGGHSRFDPFRPVSRQPLHPAEDFGNGRCQLYGLGRCALRHAVPLAVLR